MSKKLDFYNGMELFCKKIVNYENYETERQFLEFPKDGDGYNDWKFKISTTIFREEKCQSLQLSKTMNR